jgi:hypothetical protein
VSRLSPGRRKQRFDPCDQFDDGERFREIVVAASPQSAHAVVDGSERTQHQHGRSHLFLPGNFDNGQAVDAGKQAVNNHDVGLGRARLVEAFYPGRRPIHVIPAVSQLGHDFAGRFVIILDQQYFGHHVFPGPLAMAPSCTSASLR